MFSNKKNKILSLSTLIVLITGLFWLLPSLFPFENTRGNSSSFIADSLNRFRKRERAQIGEHEDINLIIRYLDPQGYKQVIEKGNASFIKVHFDSFDLLPGDHVTVSDPLQQQVYTYPNESEFTSDGGEGFWALTIFGSAAEIELHTRYSDQELKNLDIDTYGVFIDKYARGYSMFEIQDFSYLPESVCGSDQRLDAACYLDSHPVEFGKSNAVAMHVYNGLGWCSSWRVGPGNHMFTNEHCLSSQAELNASEFWFGHQRLACGRGSTQVPTIVTGKTLLEDDYLKDFALFTINESEKISEFGWLAIDDRVPVQDEEIYIPQQPGGLSPNDQRKVIAVSSDMNSENVCRIDKTIVDGRWLNTDTGYMCDTSPGASGSPVLARSSNAVLSLHHLGGCRNQGVRMNQIWPLVAEHLSPAPDLISVSVPENFEVGSAFPVFIEAQNNNTASPEGIINVSVLYSDGRSDLSITDLNALWADRIQKIEPGQGNLLDRDCQEIAGGVTDHVIEAVDTNWEPGERHTLAFNVTPWQEGVLWLRIRNTMKDVRAGCNYSSEATISSAMGVSDIDQNGWDVMRIAIDVEAQSQDSSLAVEGLTIDDDTNGASIGNSDGVVNCGETIELGVDLRNIGNSAIDGISTDGPISDAYVNIIEGLGNYPLIPAGKVRSALAVLEVSPEAPDGYISHLNFDISTSDAGPWSGSIDLSVVCDVKNAPDRPHDPHPADGSKNVSISTELSWNFESEDLIGPIIHDVYLYEGESAFNRLICVDTPSSVCDPGILKTDTQYKWYVTATDSGGNLIRSGNWSFTTGIASETPDLYLPFVFSNQ